MISEMQKAYDPKGIEEKWYKKWEDGGFFSPDLTSGKDGPAFSIVIPPPNVTGSLHMGHALDNALQDILARFKRMQGFKVLWLPGTDHAGIATQNVVEKSLLKEGIKKEGLGREEFLKRVWEWKEKYGGNITRQLRRLGASCDWSRERFTMDEGLSRAVRKAFVSLYKEGLIYKGKRMVNWCPRCTTAISDIEVEHESKKGSLWHIKYKIDGSSSFVTVATTRPETMLGDTAVAVNPEDERYSHLAGKMLVLPLVGRKIPVIKDDFVDPAFGTGAVKITPAHDPNDFEMAVRHNLPKINILTPGGKITLEDFAADEKNNILGYEGLDRSKARASIVAELEEKGFLEKIEDYGNNVGKCYRCKTEIEPYLSDQWFVKVAPLAEAAIKAVESGGIKYVPDRWTKVYLDWMTNLRDWCISRQIWWGHRIPVWYCACGEIIVSEQDPTSCPSCGSKNITQDSDVLDTWFSSSLWPFSTLGWPDDTADLKTFYPTSVLITGYDIITFWVSKMIMMGLKFMGKEPFKKVFIHGLIRDVSGKKMSKSLGNVIDPLDVIEHAGADALRFSLVSLATAGGQDLKLAEEKITEGRNFANKIWNVSRFALMQDGNDLSTDFDKKELTLADRWILSRLDDTVVQITDLLENLEFGEAARRLYEFVWSQFCDWYVELSKISLYGGTGKKNTLKVLNFVLINTLKLLHPFMPFETEEIFMRICPDLRSIMLEPWPRNDNSLGDKETERIISLVIEAIRAIRNIRAEMNVPASSEIEVIIAAGENIRAFEDSAGYIKALIKAKDIKICAKLDSKPLRSAMAAASSAQIYVPLGGLIDIEKECGRLEKNIADMTVLIERTHGKLSNPDFVNRAKKELVEAEKSKLENLVARKELINDRLKSLKD
ncbi:MAG: valine--tRNA ligase [Candidatus Margulisiibacteriota bacterium]